MLGATLDADRMVLAGWADHGGRLPAPAQRLRADGETIDLAWACPFCGRNTLRSFHRWALRAISPLG
jgi:hypothetical protein